MAESRHRCRGESRLLFLFEAAARRLGIIALGAMAGVGCSPAAPAAPAVSAPAAAAQARSGFARNLGLAMSLGKALAVGDKSVIANFTLTNTGSTTFEGCFGPSWGVSIIVEGEHDAGYLVRVEHPTCDEKLTLLPQQKISWAKKAPLGALRAGTAKVTGWVKVIDPATCDRPSGCRETSVASALMSAAVVQK